MKYRLTAFVAAVAAIAVATSCGDPTAIKAQFDNVEDTLELFALNGVPPSLPSAIRTRSGPGQFEVRVGSDFGFDVAWDIGPSGEAIAYTPRMVASQLVGTRRVGLLLAEGPFEAVLKAPTGGYKYDSLLVLPMGKVLLVDVFDPSCPVGSLLGPNIRSKIQLDSVVPLRKSLYMRILANRNCGFRDLVPGLPRE